MMTSNKPNYLNKYRRFAHAFIVAVLFGAIACSSGGDVSETDVAANSSISPAAININSADTATLTLIPHVGVKTAQKIIEHRNRFGPFRKPEQLMLVEGISDERFRRIRHLIRVE